MKTKPGLHKVFKKCYHRESGKTKSMAPGFYNNHKMMARLGWEILPEPEAPPNTTSNETKETVLRNTPQTETAKAVGLPKEPAPAPAVVAAPVATPPAPAAGGAKRSHKRKPTKQA